MLQPAHPPLGELENASEFVARHIGPDEVDETHMLALISGDKPGFTRKVFRDVIQQALVMRPSDVREGFALLDAAAQKARQPMERAQRGLTLFAVSSRRALASHAGFNCPLSR